MRHSDALVVSANAAASHAMYMPLSAAPLVSLLGAGTPIIGLRSRLVVRTP